MPIPPTAEETQLVLGKQQQAIDFMRESGIDMWITFVREGNEPITTSLISGSEYVVQNAALIFTADGSKIALLEPIDVQNGVGACFDEIITFRNDIDEPLRKIFQRFDPAKVALNYSMFEYSADGLTYGMFERLMQALGPYGLKEKMVSSEDIVIKIRAVKNQEEIERIRKAVEIIAAIADEVTGLIKPGVTNGQLMEYVSSRAAHYGCTRAGASIACNPIGENFKGARPEPIQPGDYLCSDMGVTYKGYCSDIKRNWYVLKPNETAIPPILAKQWEACQSSLEVSRKAIKVGAWGYDVHEEAWQDVERFGFVRDLHSWGHQVGRRAHDAGVWLGEKENPFRPAQAQLEENMVVTLDPTINRVTINNPGCFSMGMEELGIVKPGEGEMIYPPQKEIFCVRF